MANIQRAEVGQCLSYPPRFSLQKAAFCATFSLATQTKTPSTAGIRGRGCNTERVTRPALATWSMGHPAGESKGTVNVLPREKRIAVLAALVEGNSERAVERMCDVNRETVGRLALAFGAGAQRLHDRLARDLSCSQIIADELWGYVYAKEARVRPDHPAGAGEAYTFSALDKTSRFVITWHVGKRDQESTNAFVKDLRARLLVMPSITTDGFVPYVSAVGAEFGHSVDFAQTVKNYSAKGRRDDDHRYEPPRGIDFITKRTIFGAPDLDTASTAYVERNNATMRHHVGRIRRLVYAFSKRLPNLCAAVALNYTWYNLGMVLRTTRTTPAMAVGVTNRLWSLEEFHDAISAEVEPVAKPKKQPLTHRTPSVPARELPDGRGFLRLLPGGNAPRDPGPAPRPAPPVLREAPKTWEQLEMFGKDENQPD